MLPLGQLIITQAGDLGIPNQREVCCYRRPVMKTSTNCQYVSSRLQCYQRQCEISDKPVSIQGLKGEVLGALEPGAQSLFLLGAQTKMLILAKWTGALEYSLGALESQFFCLGALEPFIFYPGVWSPKPLWDPVHCL